MWDLQQLVMLRVWRYDILQTLQTLDESPTRLGRLRIWVVYLWAAEEFWFLDPRWL